MNSIIGKRFAFPLHLSERNQLAVVSDDVAIQQSIYIIVHTIPGERVMRPDFGCEIHELIFAPANHQTAATAERYVREALERWEPRITLHNVSVAAGNTEIGELLINIHYEIKEQHDPRSLVFPYYLIPSE